MKIALTGHTQGLGLSLYNALSKDHKNNKSLKVIATPSTGTTQIMERPK